MRAGNFTYDDIMKDLKLQESVFNKDKVAYEKNFKTTMEQI